MKKIKIWLITFTTIISAGPLAAESYSELSSVKHITVHEDIVRVRLNSMKEITGCTSSYWYSINLNEPFSKEKYSALLTAKATNEKVFFQFLPNDCYATHPRINVVYLCDDLQCL